MPRPSERRVDLRPARYALVCMALSSVGCASAPVGTGSFVPAAMPVRADPAAHSVPATEGADAHCPLHKLPVSAEYLNEADAVALELRTNDAHVKDLRAQLLPVTNEQDPTGIRLEGHGAYDFPHDVRARVIEGGVRLTFVPQRSADLAGLRSAIQQDVLAMQRGDCEHIDNLIPK